MNAQKTIVIAGLLALQGCAAGSIASAAMEMAGIRKPPELPDTQKPPRNVAIRLHASQNLNAGAGSQPLALAARIYKLRQTAAFQQMPFDGFLSAHGERELLGNDLLEVKEVMLIPGQRYEIVEKVTREAYYIGVVALFRSPAEQRWRLAFAAGDAEKSGIIVGLHACAMSVGAGAAASSETAKPLATIRCP
ncbi:type VI secretion system lipoprotein TssJ [Rugamonas sp. FT82W]|uniref:Type VI secretion system lipoprotein TssJ n=1 Tax=Duganella vulcania TaxID=2692166 RepID=A0A845FXY4_9BURK|nr:type VI secretion system lipoprotein TssJ [Duganella vulcania]MYM85609.1 type VI secretion system lipoprotein TssJ [Duganella vulcania]